ncbi:MAG: hypothetical protein EOO61_20525 [Hymenobacter sp.]|nr:MAG: hypothetical protein EOO61_20525 [Hymenobacter sp.]
MLRTTIFCALLLSQFGTAQGFLKADGQNIVNPKGENVYLKGLGLGGWMLQEGYMLKTDAFAGPQFKIKEKIAEVAGEDGKNQFYKAVFLTQRERDAMTRDAGDRVLTVILLGDRPLFPSTGGSL